MVGRWFLDNYRSKRRTTTMTVEKLRPTLAEIKSLLASDKDFLKPIVRAVLQEVLEQEMTDTLGAAKGERIEGRLGYHSRKLVTRVGKIDLRGATRSAWAVLD